MGGAWGSIKKNVKNKTGKPKNIIIQARQIKVTQGLKRYDLEEYNNIVDPGVEGGCSSPTRLDFDANVGICFLK
jgi:hypothetical protein